MNILNKSVKACLVLSLAAASTMVYAAQESDIESLERKLVNIETEMITPELRLDDLQSQRSQYDGISGWFQGSKKKALDAEIKSETTKVDEYEGQMKSLSKQIQEMVFEVAKSFENKGNYDKAIEYYLKVTNRNDTVKARLAACFKAKKDYSQAVKWLLDMSRTDKNLLEVVDCYHLANNAKSAIYWLFEILTPFSGNNDELKALKLIEEYSKYSDLKSDYPEFYSRLSAIYINKAFLSYKNNVSQATADYKKAVSLIKEDTGKSASSISMEFVSQYQDKYTEALEILGKQRQAAERNYQDKLRNAERKISDAESDLHRARRDADRHYENAVRNAEGSLRRAEDRMREINNKPEATPQEKDNARRSVDNARRELDRVRHDRERIIHDYMRPYEHRLRDARDDKDKLVRDREKIIKDYIAPYEKKVAEAKSLVQIIKALHNGAFK